METLKLDGGEGETYGGGNGVGKDTLLYAAWAQDFFTGQPNKDRAHPYYVLWLMIDNLVGLAVLRRDGAIGQCVSYYRLMVEFRQDQGYPH
jgi:hypothetical protein